MNFFFVKLDRYKLNKDKDKMKTIKINHFLEHNFKEDSFDDENGLLLKECDN